MGSNFNLDARFERASIEYLKTKDPFSLLKMSDIRWTDAKEEQLLGSDFIATIEEKPNQVVDIKSVASLIPTFSQEIINGNSERVGWIMNPELKTDYLLYVWHDVNAENYSEGKKKVAESIANIRGTQLSLCNKRELQNLIYREMGIKCTPDMSMAILSEIRRIGSGRPTSYYTVDRGRLREIGRSEREGIYIAFSNRIHEKPVNFVVRKSLIEGISRNVIVLR